MAMQFLFISSNKHQNMLPVNHQQKCLIKGICGIFDMKSNHVGPVIKVLEKLIRGRLNAKNP